MNAFQNFKSFYFHGGIVQKLIFWNIFFFLFSLVFFFNFKQQRFLFPDYLALYSSFEIVVYRFWTFISYIFFHNGFLHLLFNMLMLHFVSRFFLTFFSEKQFLLVYIIGGIFSGICFVVIFHFLGMSMPLIGASASTMAIFVASCVYQPNYVVHLPMIGKIKLWHITAVIVGFDLLFLIQIVFFLDNQYANMGGRISHLAGAFFGFLYVILIKNGIDLSSFLATKKKAKTKTPFKKVYKSEKIKQEYVKDINQQKVDDILDRISKAGYDNLSKEEKEFLFKQGK